MFCIMRERGNVFKEILDKWATSISGSGLSSSRTFKISKKYGLPISVGCLRESTKKYAGSSTLNKPPPMCWCLAEFERWRLDYPTWSTYTDFCKVWMTLSHSLISRPQRSLIKVDGEYYFRLTFTIKLDNLFDIIDIVFFVITIIIKTLFTISLFIFKEAEQGLCWFRRIMIVFEEKNHWMGWFSDSCSKQYWVLDAKKIERKWCLSIQFTSMILFHYLSLLFHFSILIKPSKASHAN